MTVSDVQSVTPAGILVSGDRDGTARRVGTRQVTTYDMTTISEDVRGDVGAAGPSDADLLARVRAGDRDAYGELWVRHEPAASSLARYLTRSNHDADDVVADAFARVLRAIDGGAGPTEAFRPYLLTAVRRTAWRRSEDASRHRLGAEEDEADRLDLRLTVDAEDRTDEGLVLQAFQELPERWQLVLWLTEIEGQPPAAVAPLLGLSANATAALAVRAREGLRQSYLQVHLQSRPADTCRFSVEHLGSFVREGLGKRDTAKVEAHLADCHECQDLQADLGSLNKALRSVVGPLVLGAGAAQYLRDAGSASSSGIEVLDRAQAVAHRLRFTHAVGLAGAAAALMVTLGFSSDLGRPPAPQPADAAAIVPVDAAGPAVVDPALVGTGVLETPGLTTAPCPGAALPLSLPAGATPTGAALVRAPDAGTEPTTVDPSVVAGWAALPDSAAVLVGDGSACVGDLIAPLIGAPGDTALAVTFLDPIGRIQVLLVPQVVTVVRDAVTAVADLALALDVQDYLDVLVDRYADLVEATGGAVTGPDGAGGAGVPGIPSGTVPGIPSGTVPDLPALPPPVDDLGPPVDDTVGGVVDGVGGLVDGVTGGLDDSPGGLLG